jgi:hypothetical protein
LSCSPLRPPLPKSRKPSRLSKITQSLNDTALYEVKDDGTVLIDWDEVEALAASKQNPNSHASGSTHAGNP